LSHCWGSSPVITSKKADIQLRRDHIQWSDLSKTFQDAITITRRLGIPYLWIDSLCIIQDDLQDWAVESSKMLSIYSGAYLTIAADHAQNGEEGCFASSSNKPLHISRIPLSDRFQIPTEALINWDHKYSLHRDHSHFTEPEQYYAPLSSLSARGWTLQERLLSRRLIHYTSWELVWECRQDIHCQCGRLSYMNRKTIMQNFHSYFRSKVQTPDLIELWMGIAEEYSKRSLTYETNKLVALSGLAKRFQSNGLQGYIAGNWVANIRDMLLWWSRPVTMSDPNCERRTEYTAPSWSWASSPSNKSIEFITLTKASIWRRSNEGRLNTRYLTRICSITAEEDTSGQLLGGRLIVVGPTITLKPASVLLKEETRVWYLVYEMSSNVCSTIPDYEREFEIMIRSGQKLTGLLWDVIPDRTRVQEDKWIHRSGYSSHIIILQQQEARDENLYRRGGIAFINWSYQGKNARPPNEIEGMKLDWGLGKDWFKDAVLGEVTII
jgi:hypothetical protein